MDRKIAEAKQNFSEFLADAFEELRRICEEEDYTLEIRPRQDRPNPFPDALEEASR